jgi:aminoglycoside 3'-phosphotransferase-2
MNVSMTDASLRLPMPPELPPTWTQELAHYAWRQQTIGRSGAAVFRLEANGQPTLFVKTEQRGGFNTLPAEAERLRWLGETGIPCPAILKETRDGPRNWLLTTAIPGRDLASSPHLAPEQIVAIAADALRDLHRLAPSGCPFDHRLERALAEAEARTQAGLVDETDFDEPRLGRSAHDLFEELLRRRPDREDLVVAHGDPSLPNLLAEAGRFSGFVDCARLGVADQHRDLAIASSSVRYNLGEAWVAPFLTRYGAKPDPERMDYYQLLDEFF